MKKIFLIAISFLIVAALPIGVYANEQKADSEQEYYYQPSEKSKELINNKSLYATDDYIITRNVSFENKDIISVYPLVIWNDVENSLDSMISKGDLGNASYYVLANQDIRLSKFQQGNTITMTSYLDLEDKLPNYIKDVKEFGKHTNILGRTCKIQNVVCFDAYTSYLGAICYYITDCGVFVRYYEYSNTEGVWFTEEEFISYAIDYFNYLISDEHLYDENGNQLYGNTISFLKFINEGHRSNPTKEIKDILIWVIPAITVVTLSLVICFIFVKKKTKKV